MIAVPIENLGFSMTARNPGKAGKVPARSSKQRVVFNTVS